MLFELREIGKTGNRKRIFEFEGEIEMGKSEHMSRSHSLGRVDIFWVLLP